MKRGMSYVFSVALITLPVLAIGGYLWSTEPPPVELQPETTATSSNNPSGTETPTVSAPVW